MVRACLASMKMLHRLSLPNPDSDSDPEKDTQQALITLNLMIKVNMWEHSSGRRTQVF